MEMKGAIFDMDGLLFDTENIYQETWNELAAENSVTLGADFVGDICGTSGAHMCRVIEKHYGVADGSIIMEECMKRVRQKLKVYVPKKPGAERIGCAPETCYVFEDSENGIRAGKAAGCTAIMIPDVLSPSEEIKEIADGIYESLEAFTLEVLERAE